jgi:hypothetical protein
VESAGRGGIGAGLSGAGFALCVEFPPFAQGEVGIVENQVAAVKRWILATVAGAIVDATRGVSSVMRSTMLSKLLI